MFFHLQLERNITLEPKHFGARMREVLEAKLKHEVCDACAFVLRARISVDVVEVLRVGGRNANPKTIIATLTNKTYDDRWKGVARVGTGLSYS